MIHRAIVTQHPAGHWSAQWESAPHEAWGGDSPNMALARLLGASPERDVDQGSVRSEASAGRIVFTFDERVDQNALDLFRELGLKSGEPAPLLLDPGVLEGICRGILTRAIEDGLVTYMEAVPSPEELDDEDLRGVAGVLRRALERRGILPADDEE